MLARGFRLGTAAAAGYLLGTIPSADTAAMVAGRGVDLRTRGSRNPGALNVFVSVGERLGRAVVVADVAKGFAACALGRRVAGDLGAHVAGVAAVGGHCYPLWNGFSGGKGVATSFGQCLYTFPAFAPLDLAVAVTATRIPGVRQRALVSAAVASVAWVASGVVWWRRGLPNSWGPTPTVALPIANAATALVVASAFARGLRRRYPDDLRVREPATRTRRS